MILPMSSYIALLWEDWCGNAVASAIGAVAVILLCVGIHNATPATR
jgi:hypothetical protein